MRLLLDAVWKFFLYELLQDVLVNEGFFSHLQAAANDNPPPESRPAR